MEFWDFWRVPLVHESKQCGLANRDGSKNWIQTSCHSYTGIPLTLWLVVPINVGVYRYIWRCRESYYNTNQWWRSNVLHCEEFDACYPAKGQITSTTHGALDCTVCNDLDHNQVVGIDTCLWKITCSDTDGGCTPHWSRVGWGSPRTNEGSGG
jgi:hypothetical protein